MYYFMGPKVCLKCERKVKRVIIEQRRLGHIGWSFNVIISVGFYHLVDRNYGM